MCESNTCTPVIEQSMRIDAMSIRTSRRGALRLAVGAVLAGGALSQVDLTPPVVEALPGQAPRVPEIPEDERENNFPKEMVADGTLAITSKPAWSGGNLPPKTEYGELRSEDPKIIVVHHTAGNTTHAVADVPDILEFIYDLHTGPDKKKPAIFYNFMIDSAGNVYETRDGSLNGPVEADATGGNQGSSQLVCLIGDFTNFMPTEAAEESLVKTLAWLADRDGIDTSPDAQVTFESEGSNRWPAGSVITTPTIAGHRDMSQTECPGDSFYEYLTTVIPQKVHAYRLAQSANRSIEDQPDETIPTTDIEVMPENDNTTDTLPTNSGDSVVEQPVITMSTTIPNELDSSPVETSSNEDFTQENTESSGNNSLRIMGTGALAVVGVAAIATAVFAD